MINKQKTALLKKGLSSVKEYGIKTTYYRTKNRKKRQEEAREFMREMIFSDAERIEQHKHQFSNPAKISILVPLYNTKQEHLKAMIESVLEQTYSEWELCLADGSDAEHEYVGQIAMGYAENDDRIIYSHLTENGGISENTNNCRNLATGDYIAMLDHDDMLAPNALFEVMKQIERGADFIYTDEEVFDGDILNPVAIHFKPDYAPDTLSSMNYICHLIVINKSLMERAGEFDKECDGSQDYDMILRCTQLAASIAHIPKVLYYWRNHADSVSSDISSKPYCITSAIKALNKCYIDGKAEKIPNTVSCYRIKYEIIDEPKVSIIVVANSTQKDLARCLDSIIAKNTYKNSEILVADIDRTVQKNDEICERYENVRHIKYNGRYNYSAVCNNAAEEANGEYLLFVDSCNVILTDSFAEELLMYAQRNDTGAVGGKLYSGNVVWSAGCILGLHGCVGNAFAGSRKADNGYLYKLFSPQNYSAVSSSLMMVSKQKFMRAEAFSTEYSDAFADIDLCLKLLETGYVNVFTPFAEADHNGKENLLLSANKHDRHLFAEMWKNELSEGDRYYNVNLSLESDDFSL